MDQFKKGKLHYLVSKVDANDSIKKMQKAMDGLQSVMKTIEAAVAAKRANSDPSIEVAKSIFQKPRLVTHATVGS